MAVERVYAGDGSVAVLIPEGPLVGNANARALRAQAAALLQEGNRRLVLDLSRVTRFTAGGLAALLGVVKLYNEAQGRIAFCGFDDDVRYYFEKTQVIHVINLFPDREEAVASFRR